MSKYKYKLGNGLAFSEEKDTKMCESFASKGYKLVKVTSFGFYKFEPSQPEEVSFAVDYTNKVLKNEELKEYIQIFESSGWSYVCSLETVHYFKAQKGTVPIYTDDSTKLHKLKMLRKISLQCLLIGIAFIAVGSALSIAIPLYFDFYHPIFGATIGFGIGLASCMLYGLIIHTTRIAKIQKRGSVS